MTTSNDTPDRTPNDREPLTDEESLLLATAIAQFLRELPDQDASEPAPAQDQAA